MRARNLILQTCENLSLLCSLYVITHNHYHRFGQIPDHRSFPSQAGWYLIYSTRRMFTISFKGWHTLGLALSSTDSHSILLPLAANFFKDKFAHTYILTGKSYLRIFFYFFNFSSPKNLTCLISTSHVLTKSLFVWR